MYTRKKKKDSRKSCEENPDHSRLFDICENLDSRGSPLRESKQILATRHEFLGLDNGPLFNSKEFSDFA